MFAQEKIKKFLDLFNENNQLNEESNHYDYYTDSCYNGDRKVIYGFDGDVDNGKIKKWIIKSMERWRNVVEDEKRDFNSLVITFKFNGEEYFHFTWDEISGKFLTEDPDGRIFAYNFESCTIDEIKDENQNDVENGQSNVQLEKELGSNDCCGSDIITEHDDSLGIEYPEDDDSLGTEYHEDDDKKRLNLDFESIKNERMASFVKDRVKINDDIRKKETLEESLDDCNCCDEMCSCDSLFCPKAATEIFLENLDDYTNYINIYDDEENIVGLKMNLIDLFSDSLFDPSGIAEIDDLLDIVYHTESDLLDYFCENFTNEFGFTKCYWDAKKNKDGSIDEITITWIF